MTEVTSAAAVTDPAWRVVSSAVPAMPSAVARICEAAEATMPEISVTRAATCFWALMSVANLTTLSGVPRASRMGL
ncbi:hypothetical protein D3C87_1895070 [compost metagenome]